MKKMIFCFVAAMTLMASHAFASQLSCNVGYAKGKENTKDFTYTQEVTLPADCAFASMKLDQVADSPINLSASYIGNCSTNGALEQVSIEMSIPGHSGVDAFDYWGTKQPSRSESLNFNTTYKRVRHHIIAHCRLIP